MKKFLTMIFLSLIFTLMIAMPTVARAGSGGGNSEFVQEYMYDFALDGGAVGFISLKGTKANALPTGAVVLSAHYQVVTAFTSGGSATVALGDAGSGARYLAATAYNNAAYTLNLPAAVAIGVPALVSSDNIANVGITVAVAALTAGKLRIVIRGYVPKG